MGLHESILDVPERLRIWQMAGVRYFYCEGCATPQETPQPQPAVAAATVPPASVAPPAVTADAPVLPVVENDPESWPAPWPRIFAKAPAHPRLVLTYGALGDDMTGHADPRRGPMWRSLFHDSGLAGQGLIAFWPVFLPTDPDLARALSIFVAGLHLLRPASLAVFGPETAKTLQGLPASQLPEKTFYLPDPHVLLQGDKEAWDHVVSILRAV